MRLILGFTACTFLLAAGIAAGLGAVGGRAGSAGFTMTGKRIFAGVGAKD